MSTCASRSTGVLVSVGAASRQRFVRNGDRDQTFITGHRLTFFVHHDSAIFQKLPNHAEPILVDRSISAGFGYQIGERDNFFGFGANWGRAPDVDRNQVQVETYYRTPIVRGLSVVPSAQYILNPAYDPDVSNLWLLAFRLRAVW